MKKTFKFLAWFVLCVMLLSGCTQQSSWNSLKNSKELKIAVLGSTDKFQERQDFFAGVDLAINDLAAKDIKVSYKYFDDEGNYDKGVSLAKEVAQDDEYLLAFSLQEFDAVNTVASIFEENEKPLIIVDGCYDRTMEKGYNYVFSITVSAEDAGNAIGQYAIKKGYKWLSIAHNGEYSINLQEGVNDAVANTSASNIIDLTKGPNKTAEVAEVLDRWQALGVNAVVLSFDDMDWAVQLVKLIKTEFPKMAIFGDQYFNNLNYMSEYGQYLEGMIMPSSYPVDSNERLQAFYNEYEPKITYLDITSITAQGYDIVSMVVEKLADANNVSDFISAMKSSDGYEGITGIKFKESGLIDKAPKYWVVKNNVVYREENTNVKG